MNLIEIGHFIVEVILILSLFRVSILFFKQGRNVDQNHKLFYSFAAILYGVVIGLDITLRIYEFTSPILISNSKDWVNITAVVITLSALGLMIRESKPKIARAPMILAFIPFLILAVYPFVADTFVLKRFLFMLLEGGGILIALLMYAHHYTKNSEYSIILGFVILLALVVGLNLFAVQWVIVSQILAVFTVYGIHKTYTIKQLQF
jgi:hypothetical protein